MEDKHIKHITSNGEIYASIFDISKMPEGLDFLTNDESFIQVGTWNYKKDKILDAHFHNYFDSCLLYTSPSPRDKHRSRMPSSA